jgi:hypothetical protein
LLTPSADVKNMSEWIHDRRAGVQNYALSSGYQLGGFPADRSLFFVVQLAPRRIPQFPAVGFLSERYRSAVRPFKQTLFFEDSQVRPQRPFRYVEIKSQFLNQYLFMLKKKLQYPISSM